MYSQTGSETSRSRTSLDWAVSRDKSFLHLAESSVVGPRLRELAHNAGYLSRCFTRKKAEWADGRRLPAMA